MAQQYGKTFANLPLPIFALVALLVSCVSTATVAAIGNIDQGNLLTESAPLNKLLDQKTIHEITKDSAGYLWIRTQNGVYKYNGYDLVLLYPGTGTVGSGRLKSESRFALDETGRLWFASIDQGLMYYEPSTRSMRPYSSVSASSSKADKIISAVHADMRGNLWLGHENGDVDRIDTRARKIRAIPISHYGTGGHRIIAFTSNSSTGTWIATETGTVLLCDSFRVSCLPTELAESFGDPSTFRITSILSQVENSVLVGTESGALIRIIMQEEAFRAREIDRSNTGASWEGAITSLIANPNGGTWIGTQRGFFLLNEYGQAHRVVGNGPTLHDKEITSLALDKFRNPLIGTHYGLYTSRSSAFHRFDESHGLRSNFVTAFTKAGNRNIWVATFTGLSLLFDDADELKDFETIYPDISYRDPRITVLEYSAGVLWAGFRSQGLQRIDLISGESTHILDPRSGLSLVSDIQLTESGSVIVSTFGGGLHILNEQGQTLRTYRAADSQNETGLRSDKILLTNPLDDGDLLIGTNNGLHIMSGTGKITRVNSVSSASEQHNHLYILSILESRDGSVWVGTQNSGLFYWGPLNQPNELKTLTPVDTSPALPSNTIYAMEEDSRGMLWFSTDNGLVKLNPRTSKIEIFDRSDGLQDNEFNIAASHKDDRGNLYFGGNHGFNRFNPEQLTTRQQIPPLRLTEIVISGSPIASDPGYALPPEILLTHKDHSIQFDFSTFDFVNPARSSYKYKLENHDRDWVDIGSRNSVSFARLPSGEYTFKLIGANSDGIWNMDGITLPIRVLPPPWLQWWAFAAYGFLLLSFLLFIKKYYDTYRLKEFATQRAASLHQTAERAQDELFDQLHVEQRLVANIKQHSINTIQLMSDLLIKQADEVDDLAAREALLENNNRLHCLKILEGNIYYRADSLEVDFHSSVNQIFRDVLADTSTQELQIVPLNESLEITMPEWLAIPAAVITNELVRNSVQHAFEGMTGVQTIRVYLRETEQPGAWLLEVADSGVGLPESIDPQRAITAGMDVIKHCANRLNASISINRENGTSFRFEIPPRTPAQSGS